MPYSRKRGESSSSGGAERRGSGLGTGPVGNAGGYSGRNSSSENRSGFSNRSSSGGGYRGGGGMRSSGGRGGSSLIVLIIIAAFVLFGGGNSIGSLFSGSSDTASSSTYSSTSGSSFVQPTTTYADTSTASLNTEVAKGSRDKYTMLKGNDKDQVTVLVYMCGADLESDYGMATSDLNEMAYATHSDQVNIIVETGGAKKWQNSVVSSSTLQRWKVTDSALVALDKNVGQASMTNTDTLTDFLKWGTKNYPADRTMLILWDHGGGSVTGYGYDENFQDGSLSVDKIAKALKASDTKYDFVGFDACLMANVEAAVAVQPYADYLIASEETEPGTGWYYTDWLTSLAKHPSVSTPELGKEIVDDFITASAKSSSSDQTSLSVTDLAEFASEVPSKLSAFAKNVSTTIKSDDYKTVADARSVTKEFAKSNRLDQIDLVHFCKNLNTEEGTALAEALQSCIKYNRVNNMKNAYGLSIYFPYQSTSKVSAVTGIYEEIGMDEDYGNAVRSFATLESSGQIATQSTSNSIFDLLGGSSSSNGETISADGLLSLLTGSGSSSLSSLLGGSGTDTDSLSLFSQLIGKNHVSTDNLTLTQNSNGYTILTLSSDQWNLIQRIDLNVWVDDGSGYIDLGLDDVFNMDTEGNLLVSYDGKWIALNDQVVAYYVTSEEFESADTYTVEGYVPAMINGQRANIILQFTGDNPDGTVLGAQTVYEDGTESKGLKTIEDGDVIDFLCDYYDYSGSYSDTYYLGDQMTVSNGLSVSTYQLTETRTVYGYMLTDIYNSKLYTPMQSYEN